jgi:hypothetical protein
MVDETRSSQEKPKPATSSDVGLEQNIDKRGAIENESTKTLAVVSRYAMQKRWL